MFYATMVHVTSIINVGRFQIVCRYTTFSVFLFVGLKVFFLLWLSYLLASIQKQLRFSYLYLFVVQSVVVLEKNIIWKPKNFKKPQDTMSGISNPQTKTKTTFIQNSAAYA